MLWHGAVVFSGPLSCARVASEKVAYGAVFCDLDIVEVWEDIDLESFLRKLWGRGGGKGEIRVNCHRVKHHS